MDEIWKRIPGFEFYEASNLGRIRSIDRVIHQKQPRYGDMVLHRRFKSRILKQNVLSDNGKYPHNTVTLCSNTIKFKLLVHRIVLKTFIGECPEGHQGCHNDGNGLNNKLDNLRWDTPTNNQLDRHKHGTHNAPVMKGSAHPKAFLNEKKVLQIRNDRLNGRSIKELSKIYLLKVSHVRSVVSRKTWRHI